MTIHDDTYMISIPSTIVLSTQLNLLKFTVVKFQWSLLLFLGFTNRSFQKCCKVSLWINMWNFVHSFLAISLFLPKKMYNLTKLSEDFVPVISFNAITITASFIFTLCTWKKSLWGTQFASYFRIFQVQLKSRTILE